MEKKKKPVKKPSVTKNDYCLEILPFPHRTKEGRGESFFINIKKISNVARKKGVFFVTSPEIREKLTAEKARPEQLGTIQVEIKGRYITVKDYHPLSYDLARPLEGMAASSLVDAAVEKYLKKKYPKHRILEPGAGGLRQMQLRKRGRDALTERVLEPKGIQIEKAHELTKKYLIRKRREKQGKSQTRVKITTKAHDFFNWGKRLFTRKMH